MEARVKPDNRYGSIVAFSGHEFIKTEWRPIPAGCEAEAERNPYLEIKAVEPEAQPTLEEIRGLEPDGEPPSLEEMRGVAPAKKPRKGKAK